MLYCLHARRMGPWMQLPAWVLARALTCSCLLPRFCFSCLLGTLAWLKGWAGEKISQVASFMGAWEAVLAVGAARLRFRAARRRL